MKAIKYAQEKGLDDYQVRFTIKADENKYTQNLFAYTKKYHLNVIFGGPISREEVFEKYASSILLFPSYVESFGLPLLEARMTGTYVIASDTPYSREILSGYDKAAFFCEMDYKAMGNEILKLQYKNE